MRVYRLRNDVNQYQYFLPENEEDWAKLEMDCVPLADSWSPPPVYIYKPRHKRGNFFNFGTAALITDPYATKVLRHYLEMAGGLLPLPYEGEEYTVLNVLECINCLDQNKTEWVYGQTTGERIGIKKYAFHRNRFSESRIFKIPENSKAEVLVVEWKEDSHDEFKYAVEEAGLRGLLFQTIWED